MFIFSFSGFINIALKAERLFLYHKFPTFFVVTNVSFLKTTAIEKFINSLNDKEGIKHVIINPDEYQKF